MNISKSNFEKETKDFRSSDSLSPEKHLSKKKLALDEYQKGLMMNVVELLEPYADILYHRNKLSKDQFEVFEILITAEFIAGRIDKSSYYAELLHEIADNDIDGPFHTEFSAKALFFLGVISLKKSEIMVAVQCFEKAIDIISNSDHNLSFILLAQIYLSASKAYALTENSKKMFFICQNFDIVISSQQAKPEFTVLAMLKESIIALYSYRFGYPKNSSFALENFINYRKQVSKNLLDFVKYSDILENALANMSIFFQESGQAEKIKENHLFAYSLAETENPKIFTPNDLIWMSAVK